MPGLGTQYTVAGVFQLLALQRLTGERGKDSTCRWMRQDVLFATI